MLERDYQIWCMLLRVSWIPCIVRIGFPTSTNQKRPETHKSFTPPKKDQDFPSKCSHLPILGDTNGIST